MTNEYLNKMGELFVQQGIREKYDVTFEDFLFLVKHDVWDEFKKHRLGTL